MASGPRPDIVSAAPTNSGPRLIDLLTSRSVKAVGGFAVGIAIVLGATALYIESMKGLGRALDKSWSDGGAPTLERLPPRPAPARWTDRDPTTAPACYGTERASHTAGSRPTPANKPISGDDSVSEDRLWWNPRGERRVQRLAAAGVACTAQSCDRKAWEPYRSALFWYLSERMHRTRDLDATYGDRGLERARVLFGGKADLDIEQGLRDRYRAGVFQIRNLRQNQDAVAILVLSGGHALRPCRL
jgi:hypothetical protein